MEVIAIAGSIVGATGFSFGLLFGWRLYRWERHLRGSRIAVAYKGKVKMNPPLIEWLQWAIAVSKDDRATGRSVYHMGGTTIAILQPRSKQHGKTTTQTKEAA